MNFNNLWKSHESHDFLMEACWSKLQNLQDLLRTPRFPIFIELIFFNFKVQIFVPHCSQDPVSIPYADNLRGDYQES